MMMLHPSFVKKSLGDLICKCSFFFRAKVFKGKKVHGEFDIKVEQVGIIHFFQYFHIETATHIGRFLV